MLVTAGAIAWFFAAVVLGEPLQHELPKLNREAVFDNNTQPCPNGWTYQSRLDQCYLVADLVLPWQAAQDYCVNITGGDLVSVLSQEEFGVVLDLARTQQPLFPVWTGLYRDPSWTFLNFYLWTDGHSFNMSSAWLAGEPRDKYACMAWRTAADAPGAGFASMPCKYAQPFVCKQHSANCLSTLFTGTEGNVTSPNYPEKYDNNLDCYYHIDVPEGKVIRITVEDWQVEGGARDFVRLLDGPLSTSYIIFNITAGSSAGNLIGQQFESSSNHMTIYFRTDYSIVYRGWFFSYEAIDPTDTVFYNATTGVITSPNYPNNYDNNAMELYRIQYQSQFVVQITIEDFVTEANYDFLRIVDGLRTSDNDTLAVLSGNLTSQVPLIYTTTKSAATILFHTDSSVTKSGWKLTYAAKPTN